MKHKALPVLFFSAVLFSLFLIPAYANSSWHWLTTSPLPVLPYAAAGTILIEFLGIARFGGIKKPYKSLRVTFAFFAVCAANLLSFIVPYLFLMTADAGGGRGVYTFEEVFYGGPFYMIGLFYLLLTLFIEIPVICLLLMFNVESKKRLLLTALAVNVITTVMVAVIERIICRGSW